MTLAGGSSSCSMLSTGTRTRDGVHVLVELDAPERRVVTAPAAERERGRRQDREVRPGRLALLAHVPMTVKDGGDADLVEELRGAARVVEAHADLARRTTPDAVRQRHDVVVQHHEPMARGLELGPLADLAEPRELRRADGPVVAKEAALRTRTRVEPDEHGVRLGHEAAPGARLVELEPEARRERPPRRALRLERRLRPAAATEREQVEIVIAGNDEEPALVLPARERRLDELPADAVVRHVTRDDDRVRAAVLDRLHGAEEAHVRVARRRPRRARAAPPGSARAARASTRDAPRGDRPWPRRARPDRASPRPRCATGSDARSPAGSTSAIFAGLLPALVEDAPARLLPDDLELRPCRSAKMFARSLHDPEAIVERVTELGDVEVRDVS